MIEDILTYNQGDIYFVREGNGPPVILIHGFSLDHRMWAPQIEYLKRTHSVISYDLRGFGKSTTPCVPYSHYDDLNALMNYLQVPVAHIVGLSLGGEIGMDFAFTYPEKVASLTLLSTSLSGYKSTVDWTVRSKEEWLDHDVFKPTKKHAEVFNDLQLIIQDYSGWHWTHKDPVIPINPDAFSRLESLHCPVTIITGENDMQYFQTIAEVIQSHVKHSFKHIIKGAGHMINLEKPGEVNALLSWENI